MVASETAGVFLSAVPARMDGNRSRMDDHGNHMDGNDSRMDNDCARSGARGAIKAKQCEGGRGQAQDRHGSEC